MTKTYIRHVDELAKLVDYSLVEKLQPDPDSTPDGEDRNPRQVFSGHYVPVKPTPLPNPQYVAHSQSLFDELGFDASLAATEGFAKLFSGDLSNAPEPMLKHGWATGYALSIFGTEYTQQCPFRTGNGYGDGRAVSIIEASINNKRWEMQLKGGGRTPYCRGGDGRAVLRSSVREFLAQEHMHALGIPSSRSLSLFVSGTEFVNRPWYSDVAFAGEPDIIVDNPVAITTRVAPSFLRVGQIELFARRARQNAHDNAMQELEMITLHAIEREYADAIDASLSLNEKVIALAIEFRQRLISLVSNWLRVGFCQGNFNSDNCAIGGYTLDYGPFGFSDQFDPMYQPWTGGGHHFAFFNQPIAAQKNFDMFISAMQVLVGENKEVLEQLTQIQSEFSSLMQTELEGMWAAKLGLASYKDDLFTKLMRLMVQTTVDYTLFFRELSALPDTVASLEKSFYKMPSDELKTQWQQWFELWHSQLEQNVEASILSAKMLKINPKYTWREWLVVPAYENAAKGNYDLIGELQSVFAQPYAEQSPETEAKYYLLKPFDFFNKGGVTQYSCSS